MARSPAPLIQRYIIIIYGRPCITDQDKTHGLLINDSILYILVILVGVPAIILTICAVQAIIDTHCRQKKTDQSADGLCQNEADRKLDDIDDDGNRKWKYYRPATSGVGERNQSASGRPDSGFNLKPESFKTPLPDAIPEVPGSGPYYKKAGSRQDRASKLRGQ